jgi:hypothetical protein
MEGLDVFDVDTSARADAEPDSSPNAVTQADAQSRARDLTVPGDLRDDGQRDLSAHGLARSA